MYETYTSQALPAKYYRELLGTAICVFNSNNAFIIEKILKYDERSKFNWHGLIDQTSGKLVSSINETISQKTNNEIAVFFEKLVKKRNRISHSFQITDIDGEQRLATKDKKNIQFVISENFLLNFIRDNEKLTSMLYKLDENKFNFT